MENIINNNTAKKAHINNSTVYSPNTKRKRAKVIIGILFLLVVLGSCSSSNIPTTSPNTDRKEPSPTVNISQDITPTPIPSNTPTIVQQKVLIELDTLMHKPMEQLAKELNTTINKGTGQQINKVNKTTFEYDLQIESDSSKAKSSYIFITIKSLPKCDREGYEGMQNFDTTLKIVGLDPNLKGSVEPYFGRSYAAWTKNYDKEYTVNTGCSSEGDVYLNYGLTKCQSLTNGKPAVGC